MAHQLPALPYDAAALEPHIDAQTMQIHHGKHHAAYVNNLNAALEKHAALQGKSAEELIKNLSAVPEDIRTAVRNNGGGHVNHTMFWQIMGPGKGGAPTGAIADAINGTFGSFDAFKEQMNKGGVGRFGSGWVWLVDSGGKLAVESSGQSGQPDDGRQTRHLRHRRLGTRLLPEVSEPPARLPRRLVEHHQLGRSEQETSVLRSSIG